MADNRTPADVIADNLGTDEMQREINRKGDETADSRDHRK